MALDGVVEFRGNCLSRDPSSPVQNLLKKPVEKFPYQLISMDQVVTHSGKGAGGAKMTLFHCVDRNV